MNDGFVTNNTMFAAALVYIFGNEALIQIQLVDHKPDFTLDVPSLDAVEYLKEYDAGTLAVADARALFAAYSMISSTLRKMRSGERDVWTSKAYQSAWCNGKYPDGRKIE